MLPLVEDLVEYENFLLEKRFNFNEVSNNSGVGCSSQGAFELSYQIIWLKGCR